MASLSARLLSHFLGKLNTATQAIPLHAYEETYVQVALVDSDQNYETLLFLSQASQEELSWWKEHLSKWNRSDHQLQCLTTGLCGSTYRRCLVFAGTDDAHQLPGVAGSHTGCEDLPEGCLRDFSAPSTGQYHNSGIHQQYGGVLSQLTELARDLWMWDLDWDITLSA